MKMNYSFKDFLKRQVPTLVVLCTAVIGLILLPSQIPMSKSAQSSVLGPRFFPMVMLGAVISFSCLSIALEAYAAFAQGDVPEPVHWEAPTQYIRVAGLLAALIVWYVCLKSVGFVIMTALLMALTMFLLGNRQVWQIIVIPVVFSLFIYLLFANFLNVPLPAGILPL